MRTCGEKEVTYGLPMGYSYELLNLVARVDQINQKKREDKPAIGFKKN